MTITLAWWWLPVASFVAGVAGFGWYSARSIGDYDVVSPMLAVGCFILGAAVAIAICIGRWLA